MAKKNLYLKILKVSDKNEHIAFCKVVNKLSFGAECEIAVGRLEFPKGAPKEGKTIQLDEDIEVSVIEDTFEGKEGDLITLKKLVLQ